MGICCDQSDNDFIIHHKQMMTNPVQSGFEGEDDLTATLQPGARNPKYPISKTTNELRKFQCRNTKYTQDLLRGGKELGRGAWGTVYEVMHKKLKIKCAVKVIEKA
jgi:hypothetical protein